MEVWRVITTCADFTPGKSWHVNFNLILDSSTNMNF